MNKHMVKAERIAIVGGGIAGLYYAWKLLTGRDSHQYDVHIFESNKHCGGRVRQIRFGGMWVAGGAGIGRKKKDHRLLALTKALGIKTMAFRHKVVYGPALLKKGVSKKSIANTARRILSHSHPPSPTTTYRQHLYKILGRREATEFIEAMGFGDDLDADAQHTLKTYGIGDNFKLGVGVRIPWNELVDKMVRELKRRGCRIHTSTPITRIHKGPAQQVCLAGQGSFSKVVLALPISALRKLLAQVAPKAARMASRIRSQSFTLLYGKSKVPVQEWLQGYTVVGGPLQKMISYGGKVAMIGYADNRNAETIAKWSTQKIVQEVNKRLGRSDIRFTGKIIKQYIPEGTHYYRESRVSKKPPHSSSSSSPSSPLSVLSFRQKFKEACPPMVRVVGEAISLDQGWVEGALQSVEEDFHTSKAS